MKKLEQKLFLIVAIAPILHYINCFSEYVIRDQTRSGSRNQRKAETRDEALSSGLFEPYKDKVDDQNSLST